MEDQYIVGNMTIITQNSVEQKGAVWNDRYKIHTRTENDLGEDRSDIG